MAREKTREVDPCQGGELGVVWDFEGSKKVGQVKVVKEERGGLFASGSMSGSHPREGG